MKTLEYTVKFLTPAFLGNAEQSGQWRTPPFKALLRQWWRVSVAADMKFNTDTMRKLEGELFGVAADGGNSHKSEIRIRLSRWDEGKLKANAWESSGSANHPEVSKPVGSDLYLGYGPLVFSQGKTSLKKNAAIQFGEEASLSLALPDKYAREIETALSLMNRYGTLGGRSRNGWGSFSLTPVGNTTALIDVNKNTFRDWRQAVSIDWPHAIGKEENSPLIWQTESHADWKPIIKTLAEIKIGLRTQFKFPKEKPDGNIHERHWLSYPVTKHEVKDWKRAGLRLPNTLLFKIRPDDQNPKMLRGIVFHMPCLPPAAFRPNKHAIEQVWKKVHTFLSQNKNLTRIAE